MADVNVISQIENIENTVMSGLKDFQKATVTRIDQLYRAGQMRVLVSDEVGLGKTLIARGTIAKLAKLQKEAGDNLVKVVYICSNASIAEQNLNKLRITSELRAERTGSSRLSMQHLNIFKQENDSDLLSRYIQLIPLTPDTSFRMTNGAGTYSERALMFAILRRLPELSPYTKALEFAMKDGASSGWDGWAKSWYETEVVDCDRLSGGKYLSYMLEKLSVELREPVEENVTYLDLVVGMCKTIEKYGYRKQNNNYVIGKLRVLFAKISLDKLEPDLVIMDEFQRFKYLINSDPESETGMLANKFFNSDKVRMLLLSATPYKMYSTLEEIDETQVDEHYSEFFDVMNFLNITEKEKKEFKSVWRNYSVHLKELTDGDTTILTAKKAAEDAMHQHICRTERVSATENADIIDDKDVSVPISVMEQDIKSYLQAQKLLEEIGASFNVPVDYVKSTPYLMSFMRDYQLKRHIEKYFSEHPNEINKMNKESFWLKRKTLDNYDKVPNGNARLDRVMAHTFKDNAELLLWVPPSKPYYAPQGVFKNAYETNYGKVCTLGRKPDDLLDVLTDMAIASPAITINRTYRSCCKRGNTFPSYLPSQIAKIFINRMNTAESTATIELACGKKSDDAHWQNLLTYCKHGNIQSMFDEYAHLISNGLDLDHNLIDNLHYTIASSMDVRTTIYTVDTYNGFKARVNGGKEKATAIRSHFAVAFTKGDGKEKDADRKKSVRNSFNSPFRPFVLASTSIGQEGLDFHNYCRRIVHWNLPSNPIDLEQREGRINRFECLAIRQNISKRYGDITFKENVWKEMFDVASKKENDGKGSDLIPFWGLTEREDMVKIERIVPMYPFSRDGLAYERLIKILSLYRLTLGQARQEELLEYIFQNCEDVDDMKKLFINLSPYYKNVDNEE